MDQTIVGGGPAIGDLPIDGFYDERDDEAQGGGCMQSPLGNRKFRIHLIFFVLAGIILVVLDLVQTDERDPMLWGLHWAPMVLLLWGAVVFFHGFSSIWGAAVDDIDDVRAGHWI